MNEDWKNQLLDLIEKKFDNCLDEREQKQLEELVLNHEEAAQLYAELAQEHALLVAGADHLRENTFVEIKPRRSSGLGPLVLAASVFLAIALLVFLSQTNSALKGKSFAQITQSNFAVWGDCTLPTAIDSDLASGTLKLVEGLVTLKFNSGAEMVLEGPVELDLIDAMNTRLKSGIVVTEIPESAKGFTIFTPTSKAIDHGTKFLTQVSYGGESTLVNVLEGEVEVVHEVKGAHHIFGGEMIKTTGQSLIQDNFIDEIGLIQEIETPRPTLKINTAQGRGDDGTAYRMNQNYHYNPELIMIKNSDKEYNRKGYLRFDLSSLAGKTFKSVDLDLFFVHSQHGSLALSQPIARFSVHAITDDRLDQWQGGLMNWQSAPANLVDNNGLSEHSSLKLGEFELERGQVNGKVSFRSNQLRQLILKDKNQLLTLVIVHESLGDQVGSNYVYGIASKNHSSVMAPSLSFHF